LIDRKCTLILMTAGDPGVARLSLRTVVDGGVRVNQRSVICRPPTSLVAMSMDPIFTFNNLCPYSQYYHCSMPILRAGLRGGQVGPSVRARACGGPAGHQRKAPHHVKTQRGGASAQGIAHGSVSGMRLAHFGAPVMCGSKRIVTGKRLIAQENH